MNDVTQQEAIVEKAAQVVAQAERELSAAREAVAAVQKEAHRLDELPEMTEAELLDESNTKRHVRRLEEEAAKVHSRVAEAIENHEAAKRDLLTVRRSSTRNARIASDTALLARAEAIEAELQTLLAAHGAKLHAEASASFAVDGRYSNPRDAFGATPGGTLTPGATALEKVGKGLALQQSFDRDLRRRNDEERRARPISMKGDRAEA